MAAAAAGGRTGWADGGWAGAAGVNCNSFAGAAGRVKEGREEKKKGEREKEVKCFRV